MPCPRQRPTDSCVYLFKKVKALGIGAFEHLRDDLFRQLGRCAAGDPSETDTEPVNIISDGTQYEEEPQMPSLSDYVPNSDEYSDWETRYGYFQLDDSQREMYDATVSALKNYSQSMPLFADSQTYSRILYLIAIEQMSVFYLKQATPTLNESGRYFDVEFSYPSQSAFFLTSVP